MKLKRKEPTCTILESPINVNYKVVGRREWLDGRMAPGALPVDRRVEISSSSDLQFIKDWLDTQKIQGLDTETSGSQDGDGLDPISSTSKIVLAQYGTDEQVFLIEPDLLPEFKSQLQNQNRLLVGQNILHDFEFILMKYDFPLVRIYDTMLAEQLLTAGLPGVKVGLKDMCCKYPPHYIISKAQRSNFIDIHDTDKFTKEMLDYGAQDVYEMFPVFRSQWPLLVKYELTRAGQDEFDCIPVTAEMELTGIALDEKIILLAVSWYVERQAEIKKEVIKLYNQMLRKKKLRKQLTVLDEKDIVDHFDIDSSHDKLRTLKVLGYNVSDVKRETLNEFNDPFMKLLAEYTECQKITSTYGQSLLDKRHPLDGLFHPEFHQMGQGEGDKKRTTTTATERFTSDAQQIPRPENEYKEITNTAIIAGLKERHQAIFDEALA